MRRTSGDAADCLAALGPWADAASFAELIGHIDAASQRRGTDAGIAVELVLDHGRSVGGRWLALRSGLVWLLLEDRRLCAIDTRALQQIIVAPTQLPGEARPAALSDADLRARLKPGLDDGRLIVDWQAQQAPATEPERLAIATLMDALARLWPLITGDPLGHEACAALDRVLLRIGAQLAVRKDSATLIVSVPPDPALWPTDAQLRTAIEARL